MIIGTSGIKKDPYILVSGNMHDSTQPCSAIPLVVGCKSNSHYQSLLPEKSYLEENRKIELKKNVKTLNTKTKATYQKVQVIKTESPSSNRRSVKINPKENGNFLLEENIKTLKTNTKAPYKKKQTIETKTLSSNGIPFNYKVGKNYKIFYIQADKKIRCTYCSNTFKVIQCHLQRSSCSVPNLWDFS